MKLRLPVSALFFSSCLVPSGPPPPVSRHPEASGAASRSERGTGAVPEDGRFNWLFDAGFEDAELGDWDGGKVATPGRISLHALALENARPAWNEAVQIVPFGSAAPARIVLAGFMKVSDVTSGAESWMRARALVDFADTDGKQVGGWQSSAMMLEGSTGWVPFQWTYDVPRGAAQVAVHVGLPNIVGKAWFDDLDLALLDKDGSRRAVERPRFSKTDTSDWYAFAAPRDPASTAVDLSFLNDKPAGRHGFVQSKGGHFVFKDGTQARFWGTNLVAGNAFPTHLQAEITARRLARLGVNLVRLHHMDAPWATPNIFDPQADDTQTLSSDALDRFDYFVAELKKSGIYVYPDLLVHRRFKRGDRVSEYEELENGAKGVVHFDRRIIELNELYARVLFLHKNKYTGLSLAEDPVVLGSEIVNESSIFTGFDSRTFPASYEAELGALIKTWGGKGKLTRFGYDWATSSLLAVENSANARDTLRFLSETEEKSNAEMRQHLASSGVHALLTGSNIGLPILAEIRANAKMDFMDTHFYWDHPQVWKMADQWARVDFAPIDNRAQLKDPAAAMPYRLAAWKVVDKPLIVTEWNDCFPNEQRLEGPVVMAAYGSLQGWDGMLQYDYGGHDPVGSVKMTAFAMHARPDNEPLFQAGALIYRRRYIEAAREEVIDPADDDAVFGPGSKSSLLSDHPWLPYAVRVSKQFTGKASAAPPSLEKLAALHDEAGKIIRSSGGELELRHGAGVLKIDGAKVQGFTGGIGTGEKLETKNLVVSIAKRNPWVSLLLVSVDGKRLEDAGEILLVAVGRAENSGQVWNATRKALTKPGEPPVLMEGVKAEITWKPKKPAPYVIAPLDANGVPGAALATQNVSGSVTFSISPSQRTSLYWMKRR